MHADRLLIPPLLVGERVTLRLTDPARDLIGFVTAVDPLIVEDRHGGMHPILAGTVVAARRAGVSLGRDPHRTPRALLDDLADRAGVDVLHCPANFAPWHGRCARVLTLHDVMWRRVPDAVPAALRAATFARPRRSRSCSGTGITTTINEFTIDRLNGPPPAAWRGARGRGRSS